MAYPAQMEIRVFGALGYCDATCQCLDLAGSVSTAGAGKHDCFVNRKKRFGVPGAYGSEEAPQKKKRGRASDQAQ